MNPPPPTHAHIIPNNAHYTTFCAKQLRSDKSLPNRYIANPTSALEENDAKQQ